MDNKCQNIVPASWPEFKLPHPSPWLKNRPLFNCFQNSTYVHLLSCSWSRKLWFLSPHSAGQIFREVIKEIRFAAGELAGLIKKPFDTPLWMNSVLGISWTNFFIMTIFFADSQFWVQKLPSKPSRSSYKSSSRVWTAGDDGQDSDFLDDDINFEQDSEDVEGDIDFLNFTLVQARNKAWAPQTIHDFSSSCRYDSS